MQRIALLAIASALTHPAAAADEDLNALREEIAQMKKSYEQRIEALEQRLAAAESAPVKSQSAQDGAAPARAAGGFNPEVSLILQGQYRRMKDVPERSITGYWPAGGHGHGHVGGLRRRSQRHDDGRPLGRAGGHRPGHALDRGDRYRRVQRGRVLGRAPDAAAH